MGSAVQTELKRHQAEQRIYIALAEQARRNDARWTAVVPAEIRAAVEAADTLARERNEAANREYASFLDLPDGIYEAREAERRIAHREAIAATLAYHKDGRHVVGRHQAAMLRWASRLMAAREEA